MLIRLGIIILNVYFFFFFYISLVDRDFASLRYDLIYIYSQEISFYILKLFIFTGNFA